MNLQEHARAGEAQSEKTLSHDKILASRELSGYANIPSTEEHWTIRAWRGFIPGVPVAWRCHHLLSTSGWVQAESALVTCGASSHI
ncbi:hypothetical protein RRG08_018783 [Elysia crispata]|uniref:Uncharacterized protein n=1 Tax=Elysia crispata TaxID=231223 RepID=A0AAE1AQP9_9GAST|nr:hypothetical protein RRG08_018783 [Elysia crispata]